MPLLDESADSARRHTPETDAVCERITETEFRIQGRDVSLPLEVRDCSILAAMFWANAAAARRLVSDAELFVPAPLPGRTPLLLLAVKYRDSPLGDYGEAAVLFPADVSEPRPGFSPGSLLGMLTGKVPQFVYRMAVDQEFTLHAGRFLWGYPKYLANIDVHFDERHAEARLEEDGEPVFTFRAPAASGGTLRETRGTNLTVRGGVARRIVATVSGSGVAFSLGGEVPEIGERAPLARELRELGLPKRPVAAASIRHATFRFGVPETVRR
ncbi:MAG TPA: acetoacetate decarboxylase family protein [Polyangiaceae bacterium]|nr:acetoacetate decarboxylase family protein [Polyangiaceae bacterium]